jgi:hypothetical protein
LMSENYFVRIRIEQKSAVKRSLDEEAKV